MPTTTNAEYNESCWPQYALAIELSGGSAVKIELEQRPESIARLASTCSGIILPGSPADVHPQKYGALPEASTAASDSAREAADELLLQDAFNLHKPIFGICYGHQSLNVWRGGTLIQHLETGTDHAPGSRIEEAHGLVLSPQSRVLSSALVGERLKVNSSHHQAVATPGDGLFPAAWCLEDGSLEAVEGSDWFTVGVQWHPERTFEKHRASRQLFRHFVLAAAAWESNATTAASGYLLDRNSDF